MKFLILLAYYRRPTMVRQALTSISNIRYDNWELHFIDDSGDDSFESILKESGIDNNKLKYIAIHDSEEQKRLQGGSRHGQFMNESILQSDADIIIILCDDDAILPDYLSELNSFYNENTDIMWAYSKVKYYNPTIQNYTDAHDNYEEIIRHGSIVNLNVHTGPMDPNCRCDSSQVSFRRNSYIKGNVWYPYPQTRNLDSAIYTGMYQAWGPCHPTNIYGQCKGVFSDQLGHRSNHGEFIVSNQ